VTGRMVVVAGEREWMWGCEDEVLVAAIDRVFRRRLTAGESVYLTSSALETTGRSWATIVIPPGAFVSFSYTDNNSDDVSTLTLQVQELVDRDGGITVDADDQLII
jgi:hypothetical protein